MTCRIAAMLLACLEDLHVDYVAFRATPAGKIALITLAAEADASRLAGALGVGLESTGDDKEEWLYGQACLEGVALYIRGPGRRRPQLEVVP